MSISALETLKQRAAALAARDREAEAAPSLSLVFARRGGRWIAFRLEEIRGAGRVRTLTLVPGGPPWVLGVVQHRGDVLSVLDLVNLWGDGLQGVVDLPSYVVLGQGERQIAVAVEDLVGVTEVEAAPTPYRGEARAGVAEIARRENDSVLVLSASRLFADERLSG